MTRTRSGRLSKTPWMHLRARAVPAPKTVDLNAASGAELRSLAKLSDAAVRKVMQARRRRPLRDVRDLARVTGITKASEKWLTGRVVGSIRTEVVLTDVAIVGEHMFSDKRWALDVQFFPPTRGRAVLVVARVQWLGEAFEVEQKVTARHNREGRVRLSVDTARTLPAGPAEIEVKLYDDLGGASSRTLETWVLPSNPLSLFLSPGDRSLRNGTVRPNRGGADWVTPLNLTFVNGDPGAVSVDRNVTWRFWDGGVGGTLIESGTFRWPSSINVSANGTWAGWLTFTSPPGSGIHNTYENMEDMTIELIFNRPGGGTVSSTITCRIMGGWGINIIEVGSSTAAQSSVIVQGVNDARDVYEDAGLTFSSVDWWIINDVDVGGYRTIGDQDEMDDLRDDWSVPGSSLDCFIVDSFFGTTGGLSPAPGPDSKGGKKDGLGVERSMVCLAHEIGHYIGGLDHADSLGLGNVMHSTCGGTSLTYDQYKEYFDHTWTRIVR